MRLMRRVLAVVTSVSVIVGIMALWALPALAWDATLEGEGRCDEETWEWNLTWTLTEPGKPWGAGHEMVVISSSRDLFAGVVLPHGGSVSVTEQVTVSGVYTMEVKVGWTGATDTYRASAQATLEGTCQPSPQALVPLSLQTKGICREATYVIAASVTGLQPGESVLISAAGAIQNVAASGLGEATAEFPMPAGVSNVVVSASTAGGRSAEAEVPVASCASAEVAPTPPQPLPPPAQPAQPPATVAGQQDVKPAGSFGGGEPVAIQVLPQIVTAPPETLPFTGFGDGAVGAVGFAFLALGSLVALAMRGRKDETGTVVVGGFCARLSHYDLKFWPE